MHQYENLLVQIEQGVMWLTINRPEQRNALNQETLQELGDAFSWAEANDEVRCIIIQGAGEKSFAAGADIKQLHERKMLEALIPGMQGLYKKIEQSSKVTIAAVKGYALGGGCELALACDIRIAAKKQNSACQSLTWASFLVQAGHSACPGWLAREGHLI